MTQDALPFTRRHFRVGWTALVIFATLGLTLEALLGLKLGFYLDVGNDTRRVMWRLAHAHGVLIGVLNVAFAASLHAGVGPQAGALRGTSLLLLVAQILLPLGFFLGGTAIHGGDPSALVFIAPVGSLSLLLALLLMARATYRA